MSGRPPLALLPRRQRGYPDSGPRFAARREISPTGGLFGGPMRPLLLVLVLAVSAAGASAQEPRTFPDLEFAGADGAPSVCPS